MIARQEAAIALCEVTKKYGPVTGVEDITFDVEPGEIFGFLGPNGAGKTTCLRLILGMIRPDQGSIRLFGRDLKEDSWRFKARVGSLPGEVDWWPQLTGREVIDLFARFRSPPPLQERLLALFRMEEKMLRRPVRTYSRGERRKVGLVIAMQHDPDLLLLDEPTSGLDPLLRKTFHDLCVQFKERGKTVLLSSHDLFEVQLLCDRVAVLRRGRISALERIESLRRISPRRVEVRFENPQDRDRFSFQGVHPERIEKDRVVFKLQGPPGPLLDALSGLAVRELTILPPSLEDLFLHCLDPRDPAAREGEES